MSLSAARRIALCLALCAVTGAARAQTQSPAAAQPAQAQNRVLLDLLRDVETLGRQMREMRGALDEMSNRLELLNDRVQKAEKRQGDLYNDTDARVRRIEQLAKDDGEARKKLAAQVSELELRLKKLELAAGAAPTAAQLAEIEARLGKSGAGVSPEVSLAQIGELDLRLKKLEAAALAAAAVPAPAGPAVPPVVATPVPAQAAAVQGGELREVAPGPTTAPVKAPATAAAAPASNAPVVVESDAIRRAYESALNRQRSGDAAGAVQEFRSFLKQYPRHELVPNAQYWLGEAYFRVGDYQNAIAAEQKLLVTYPDHLKAPDAMVILANAQAALGDSGAARRTLEDVIAKYPATEAAEKAKQRLARLK